MKNHKLFQDEAERRKWQNPKTILAAIGIKPNSTFIDIGCGQGFFTLPAAKLVGEKGRVYGIDVDAEYIGMVKKKAKKEGLKNIKLMEGKAEETIICNACADIVFFGTALHDFADPARVLVNARKMLKPNGLVVNLDWKKEPMELGPPLQIRFSQEKAAKLIQEAGFTVESVKEAGPYHYVIAARP